MYNIPQLFFLEEPIDTKIGLCRFFKVKEYWKAMQYGEILTINKNDLLGKTYDKIPEEIFNEMIDKNLLEIIKKYNHIFGLYDVFKELFNILFIDNIDIKKQIQELEEYKNSYQMELNKYIEIIKQAEAKEKDNILNEATKYVQIIFECNKQIDILKSNDIPFFDRIKTIEEFEYYRKLIRDMNHITYEKPNSNKELAYFDKLERISKEQKGEIITFKSMVTSVGLYRQDVLEISIDSLYSYFDRIQCFEGYHAGVTYQTIASEKPYKLGVLWFTDTSVEKTKLTDDDKQIINKHLGMVEDKPEEKGIVKDIK